MFAKLVAVIASLTFLGQLLILFFFCHCIWYFINGDRKNQSRNYFAQGIGLFGVCDGYLLAHGVGVVRLILSLLNYLTPLRSA